MRISPRKILIVHAKKGERVKLAIMLARFGHCVSFLDGRKGSVLSPDEYDLIIVDDRLPGQTGFDFINLLLDAQCEKVIYLSSCLWLEAPRQIQKLNVYEWILKPVDSLKLAVVVCDFFISNLADEKKLAVSGH